MKNVVLLITFLLTFLFFVPLQAFAKVWINEFSSNGSNDWIELYNDADVSVALDDIRIRDGSATNKLDLTGQITGKGFAVFEWSSKLNNDGDSIHLLMKNDESIIDQVSYGDSSDIVAPAVGQTAGRQQNGSGSWVVFATGSKGTSNAAAPVAPAATQIPVNTPTPTKEPTPTKIPTPTRTPVVSNKTVKVDSENETQTKAVSTTLSNKTVPEKVFRISGVPTAILGIATVSATPKTLPNAVKPQQKILVKNASLSPPIVLIVGAVFILACGILVYLRHRIKSST
jgi:hypothetical protein